MIKFNKIEPETHRVFFNGELLGTANEYEFNDLRLQVNALKIEGLSIEFEGKMYPIDKTGRLYWPHGLFDLISEQLSKLF